MATFTKAGVVAEPDTAAAGQPLRFPKELTPLHKFQFRTNLCELGDAALQYSAGSPGGRVFQRR